MRRIGFKTNGPNAISNVFSLSPKNDFQHSLIMGATGSGKTVSLILPMINERMKQGYGMMIYAYKGHEHRRVKYLAHKTDCLNLVMEIGKPNGRYMNLMTFLDENALKKVILALYGNTNANNSDYWAESAAKLGFLIVDILRKINHLVQRLEGAFRGGEKIVNVSIADTSQGGNIKYKYPICDPSFKVLSEITKDPKSLKLFFSGLKDIVKNAYKLIENSKPKMDESGVCEVSLINSIKKVIVAILRLEKSIKLYDDYSIELSGNESSGNNGLLQILNNAIQNISAKDYVNTDDIDIIEALNQKAIIIFDIEGLDSVVHEVLLESILNKLSRRIKDTDPNPVSIIIDEANRVLGADTDMHNDILRESKVELIIAVQNEEQMITKFGEIKWESIASNFVNSYDVSLDHYIAYNDTHNFAGSPIIIEPQSLDESEYLYNRIRENRMIFEDFFIGAENLPECFIVQYDNLNFEKNKVITLITNDDSKIELEYVGREIKKELQRKLMILGFGEKKDHFKPFNLPQELFV